MNFDQIFLSPIPLSELKSVLREIVAEEINAHQSQKVIKEQLIVDGKELEEKLGVTRQTLANWRAKKIIPFIRHGSVIRYDLNKVMEALERKNK